MRVDELLAQARSAGLDRADAQILLAACSGRSRTQQLAWPEFELDAAAVERFEYWQQRRLDGVPVAYLLGTQEFYGLALGVGPEVLVPRPETELLVEFALHHGPEPQPCRVLDLGTGSGAIALAIATQRPHWQVHATDRSEAALARAQANAVALGASTLRWSCGDWLEAVNNLQFDIIVSNPPYLASNDSHLTDLRHEPLTALVAGDDALQDLLHLVRACPAHLSPDGWLALEHGWTQGAAVRDALQQRGYRQIDSQRDLAGHERISFGRRPATAAGNSGTSRSD